MLINDVFKDALKRKYALGAFNFYNLESMKAILNVANKLGTSVIIAVSEASIKYFNPTFLKNAIVSAKNFYKIPFFVHLDHGKSLDTCKLAIKCGFDSVMIDGSSLPFEENVKLTKSVAIYAHKKGVFVEGELGVLKGIEDDVSNAIEQYTDPKSAKEFVERTNVDSLAIAIGTSHGINKFVSEPKLKIDILKKIEKQIKNTPLVLHGASSVPQEYVNKINKLGGKLKDAKGVLESDLTLVATKHNICKINVDSDLRLATTMAIKEYFNNNPNEIDPRKYLAQASEEVEKLVEHKIKDVFKTKPYLKK